MSHRETPAPDVIGGDVSNAYEAFWIGIGGWASYYLIQAGIEIILINLGITLFLMCPVVFFIQYGFYCM